MPTNRVDPAWIIVAFVGGAVLAVVLLDQLLRLDLVEGGFWTQFWPALLATFAGVVLALWFDRVRDQAARRSEEAHLLRALRDNLTINLQVLDGLKGIFAKMGERIPMTQVDTAFLDAIFPRLAQVSTDTGLTTTVALFRHSLNLLNRRLDYLTDTAQHPQSNIPDAIGTIQLLALAQSIAKIIPEVEKLANDVLSRIDARIGAPPSGTRTMP
jgi:hypothetical protein